MKKKNGITLIALIITIIVMLILVGVSVTVALNGGLINKARESSEETEKHTIYEKIVFAMMLDDNGNILVDDTIANAIIVLGDRAEEIATDEDENKILKVEGNFGTYYYEIGEGGISIAGPKTATGIDYGENTVETVDVGDTITIGTGENIQSFMVINKENNKITALPYYNITLDETSPIQSSTAEESSFSDRTYWDSEIPDETGYYSIDMTDSRNNIQKYITAYKTTLTNLGATNIKTRVALNSDIRALTSLQRNPGETGSFWTGTSDSSQRSVNTYGKFRVFYVNNSGGITGVDCYNKRRCASSYRVFYIID